MRINTQVNHKGKRILKRISEIVKRSISFAMLGLEGKQWLASFMIAMLLLPVFSIPASAFAVPIRTDNNAKQYDPVNANLPILEDVRQDLNAKLEEWTTPWREVNVIHDEKENSDKKKVKEKKKSDTENKETLTKKSEDSVKKEEKAKKVKNSEELTTEEFKKVIENEVATEDMLENSESVAEEESLKVEELISKERASNKAMATTAMIVNQLPEDEFDSVYSYENNVGSPPGQVEMDSANEAAALRIKHRVGIANFSFGVPLASLSGRGIDASIGMTYNSRTWNKSYIYNNGSTTNHFTYDVEDSWIAPGFSTGFGTLDTRAVSRYKHYEQSSDFEYYTVITPLGITSPDGSRHQFTCTNFSQFPGTYTSKCTNYSSTDGTYIDVPGASWKYNQNQNPNTVETNDYSQTSFIVTYPNGSKIWYSGGFGSGTQRKHYPLIIQDGNGNRIRIAYKPDGSGRIDKITDTLNREIKFYYENNDKLVAVTIPGLTNGSEIQTVRFYYDDNFAINAQNKFNGQVDAPATIRVLKYVYMPSTKTGYEYEYNPSFGMIQKITRRVNMTVSDANNLTATGTVTNAGNYAASTEYNYPSGSPALNDAPKYTKRTDDWAGKTSAIATETLYHSPDPIAGQDRLSVITVKDNGFDIETETKSHNTGDWKNGLIKETSVNKKFGPAGQYTKLMSKTVYTWGQNGTYGRQNPVLEKIETTNETGLTKTIEYDYDQYSNQTEVREFGYGTPGNLLRTTEISYETGASWINRKFFRLTKSVVTKVGGVNISKTEYEYDGATLTPRNDISTATHDTYYNPAYPAYDETICPDGEDPGQSLRADGCIVIHHPGYDSNSVYRGNVTKVTRYSDATLTNDPDADVTNMKYDIAGNLVESSLSCCQVRTYAYSKTHEYAYPISQTSGSSPQLTTSVTYNRNTGLVETSTDENNQITNYDYESDTLRRKKVIYPNGGYVETEYSDKLAPGSVPGFVRTITTLEAGKTVQSYSYFDGQGLGIRSATETASDGWIVSAMEYDHLSRPVKSYNPFYASTPNGGIPAGTKFTEVTNFDALGRTTQVKLQDNTTVSTAFSDLNSTPSGFNKTFVTVTDQAGKQRRQLADALGRVVRVDEPDSNGDLGLVNDPNQPTTYEYDGNDNLVKVIQSDGTVTQERLFKYDSLSRLTHEKQVEANATLDADGNYVGTSSGIWTKYLKYEPDGLLDYGVDARGVKTDFNYDGLNRVEWIKFSDDTPQVNYYYDQARSGYFNKGALTRVETVPNQTNPRPDTPDTATEFDYDKMGRVKAHRQTIGTQTYSLGYEYNLAGQLTKEIYPSGREVSVGYDAKGRLASIADQSRTYANGFQFQGKGTGLSEFNLGNGTNQTFSYNDRLQMESQILARNAEILQKYDYGYEQLDANNNLVNNGQLTEIVSHIGTQKQWTQKFSYDEIGRLEKAEEFRGDTEALSYKQKFDYDRFGNKYHKVASNPTTGQEDPIIMSPIEETDIDKNTNRFKTATGTVYDDAGNVTQDTQFRNQNLYYDANGRVYKTAHTNNINQSNAVYDASGNRVATQIDGIWTFMVYDAFGKMICEYGGLEQTDEGGVKYVLQDWQGSSRAIVGQNGQVKARMDYTAFGNEIQSGTGLRTSAQGFSGNSNLDQKYAQTERDEATGLDHTWFRKLENQAGRWTSPDPYNGSMSLGNPQSFNRYSYVDNQPTNYIDPTGLLMSAGGRMCFDIIREWYADGVYSHSEYVGTFCIGGGGSGGYSGGGRGPNIDVGVGANPNNSDDPPPLPFNSCSEFVDWLIGQAKSNTANIINKKSRASWLGTNLMTLAYFGYDRHINNGYDGFKGILTAPGTGTEEGAQGAGVYGHILGMSGAYLTETIGGVIGTVNSLIDRTQGFFGKAQSPAEIAGNAAGTAVGKHIWNFINGNGNEDDLKKSLTSELCE